MLRTRTGQARELHAIPVPKMGKSSWGTIFGWAKKPGDKIAIGDRICHIERGQVTDDVRSPTAGIMVERCVGEEEHARVGDNLCILDITDTNSGSSAPAPALGGERKALGAVELLARYQNQALLGNLAQGNVPQDNSALFGAMLSAAALGQQAQEAQEAEFASPVASASAATASMGSSSARVPGLPPAGSMFRGGGASFSGGSPLVGSGVSPYQVPTSALGAALGAIRGGASGSAVVDSVIQSLKSSQSIASQSSPSQSMASSAAWAKPSLDLSPTTTVSTPLPVGPKAAAKAKAEDFEKFKCHLHKKTNKACKFCKRYDTAKQEAEDESNAKRASKPQVDINELTFNCSPLLKERLVGCSYYKSLFDVDNVDGLLQEIKQFADSLDVYRTSTEPSCFMCCVYRLFTMNSQGVALRRLLDNDESAIARCVGLLYIRFVAPPDQLWDKLEEFVLDDEELKDIGDGEVPLPPTIGEYVEDLLLKDKYFNSPLPRIPAGVRRKLEEVLAPMSQIRKRSAANKYVFRNDLRHPETQYGMEVELCDGGTWRQGKAVEVVRQVPTRVKIRVKLDDGPEVLVHVGKVVVREKEPLARGQNRDRSRSPGRGGRGNSPDWSRFRGRADAELVEELRERSRADAVCSDRKGYAKRLPRYEVGLATNRDKGREEAKLIEEGTIPLPGLRRRQPEYPEEEEPAPVWESSRYGAEEYNERKKQMRDIYEKYGLEKKPEVAVGSLNEIEGPDTMRLG